MAFGFRDSTMRKVPLQQIAFDTTTRMEGPVEDLLESIKETGQILQPVLLRKTDRGNFFLLSGKRRLRAARELGMQDIPAMIMETDLRKHKLRDKVPMTFVTAEPYIGHLGLGGVGNSKGMIEDAFRDRHIKWICNARVTKVEQGKMFVSEMDEAGQVKKEHELPFKYSMLLPAFKGIDAVFGIDGLTNPRGFILIDPHQRNPRYPNVFAIGVCVAIPPVETTPVPTGTPKTGYMIESMVSATAHNIRALLDGREPAEKATWNAVCLADFGDTGVAFVALPQIPPRNVNWFSEGKWVHLAKVAFEKYFLRKIRKGNVGPFYENMTLKALGIGKLKG